MSLIIVAITYPVVSDISTIYTLGVFSILALVCQRSGSVPGSLNYKSAGVLNAEQVGAHVEHWRVLDVAIAPESSRGIGATATRLAVHFS